MSSGASTQLVSNELDAALKSQALPQATSDDDDSSASEPKKNDGELEIDHSNDKQKDEESGQVDEEPEKQDQPQDKEDKNEEPDTPEESEASKKPDEPKDEYLEHLNLTENPHHNESSQPPRAMDGRIIKDPPHFTGQLTANTVPEEKQYSESTDPMTNASKSTLLDHKKDESKSKSSQSASSSSLQDKVDQTLREIEESVSSPHLNQEDKKEDSQASSSDGDVAKLSVDEARKAAEAASSGTGRSQARQDMGTSQLGGDIGHGDGGKKEDKNDNPPPPVPPPMTPSS